MRDIREREEEDMRAIMGEIHHLCGINESYYGEEHTPGGNPPSDAGD